MGEMGGQECGARGEKVQKVESMSDGALARISETPSPEVLIPAPTKIVSASLKDPTVQDSA